MSYIYDISYFYFKWSTFQDSPMSSEHNGLRMTVLAPTVRNLWLFVWGESSLWEIDCKNPISLCAVKACTWCTSFGRKKHTAPLIGGFKLRISQLFDWPRNMLLTAPVHLLMLCVSVCVCVWQRERERERERENAFLWDDLIVRFKFNIFRLVDWIWSCVCLSVHVCFHMFPYL